MSGSPSSPKILTHDQAKSYMLWRHVVIRQSGASMTIEEGSESWDEWVQLGLGVTSLTSQVDAITGLIAAGADAGGA